MTNEEVRKRIQVSLWAYAYEIGNRTLVDDATFDRVCLEINPEVSTGNPLMDKFFREEFDPSTGYWIYSHPEIEKIEALYEASGGDIDDE